MTAESPCILCDTADRTVLYEYRVSGQTHRFVICEGCGLACVDPIPTAEHLAEQYARGEFTRHIQGILLDQKKQAAMRSSAKFLRLLAEIRNVTHQDFAGVTLVDLGCGFGQLSASLAECFPAANILGVEPEVEVVRFLRSINTNPRISVEPGVAETFAPPSSHRVGGLFMFDVFEHLPDPLGTLRHLHRAASDDAWVFILLPDLMDPGSVFGPRSFFHAAHMYYYTDRTLGGLMARAGFQPRMTIQDQRTHRATGCGVMVAAQRVAAASPPVPIPGEAERVRRRLRTVQWQTAVAGPMRYFYRYNVRRPLLRRASAVKHFVLGGASRGSA